MIVQHGLCWYREAVTAVLPELEREARAALLAEARDFVTHQISEHVWQLATQGPITVRSSCSGQFEHCWHL